VSLRPITDSWYLRSAASDFSALSYTGFDRAEFARAVVAARTPCFGDELVTDHRGQTPRRPDRCLAAILTNDSPEASRRFLAEDEDRHPHGVLSVVIPSIRGSAVASRSNAGSSRCQPFHDRLEKRRLWILASTRAT